VHASLPAVLKGAHFGLVAPDHLVVAIGEERRVAIDQVNAIGGKLRQTTKVVVAIDDTIRISTRWVAVS
jgi:hypothetical protein